MKQITFNKKRLNKKTTIRIVMDRVDGVSFIEMTSEDYNEKRTKNNYNVIEITNDQREKLKKIL